MKLRGLRVAVGLAAVAGAASPALALETEYVPEEVTTETPDHLDGWSHQLDLGAALQVGGSHSVAGQTDGTTVTLSANIAYAGSMWRGSHELRLTGLLSEAVSRTPVVDDMVKSADVLSLESVYFFHVPGAPWIGPYVRASGRTSIFDGVDVRSGDVVYVRDGETLTPRDRLLLTRSFAPTYLKQSAGVFARPQEATAITVDIRLGAGARETLADGSYVVDDDGATAEIEVKALQTYMQAGAEGALEAYGTADEGAVSYGARAEVMIPFYSSVETDLDAIAATNIEIGANFGARLNDWASVQYQLGLLRVPQILEEWQVTNSLLLSFGYSYTRTPSAP
ncbi:MAG: hypothetical protein H6700_05930 [Myxococcales bacterium]|nr:hypothetical protein [Myxococcales bacterium]MCB9531286.1 hypothetical protein [Myxococcales bacterium]